jgi:carbon monoxide dehydrogenase subunit G
MNRLLVCVFTVALLLVTADRLPAPIQEVVESPTPKPEQTAKPKPKSSLQPKPDDSRKQRAVVKATPTAALLFAGTWLGVSGELRGRTVTVNPTETSVSIDGGPWGRETGSVEANAGGQLIWSTTPLSVRVKWTFTLVAGGKSAQLTNKHFLGSETGTFQKQK